MNIFNAIIIDDDRNDVEALAKSLSQYQQIEVKGSYTNATDGLAAVLFERPDVVFLDIEMPGMTGLEFMERLDDTTRRHCRIVVYTSFINHVVEAFRHKAVDVLLKPIDPADLNKVIAHLLVDEKQRDEEIRTADDGILEAEKDLLMFINKSDFQVVRLHEICLFIFEEKTRRWQTYARDGNKVYSFTLKHNVYSKEILSLSSTFVQINKKYIINIEYLMMLKDNECVFFAPFKSIKGVTTTPRYKKILMDKFANL